MKKLLLIQVPHDAIATELASLKLRDQHIEFTTARDPDDAIEVARRDHPDIILIDADASDGYAKLQSFANELDFRPMRAHYREAWTQNGSWPFNGRSIGFANRLD